MQRQIGFIKNQNQIIIRQLGNTSKSKVVDFDELSNEKFDCIFYNPEQLEEESIHNFLTKESKHTPVQETQNFFNGPDQFESESNENLAQLFEKVSGNWVLQNNIVLLDELFEVVDHLKALWPNDRTAFFEELWHIFKVNLGASKLKFIYNDIENASKNNDKKVLVHITIDGERVPNPTKGKEFEEKLMKHFESEFVNPFQIVEYDENKGQLTICGNIYKSPFLVMANISSISKLQESILATLIKAISR
ncbi:MULTISPECIES: hypothetical protein [Halobacteriovorax]|uniref:Uncharacterized protein n=1 Tax=Halobacteriovorax vibrionivorans TaxID=2152716 RepID=A0ABY0II33_9BACT|nr:MULTISPECIES: hypothetical protein [Halobacteriovorax]RZF22618.1 hypothetical protein DAY19_02265 [Halobacteriovorax vibrionivorans]TGD47838.1 hypothetical protein EP118_06360 [Halobacteriovorax sp. Y22]